MVMADPYPRMNHRSGQSHNFHCYRRVIHKLTRVLPAGPVFPVAYRHRTLRVFPAWHLHLPAMQSRLDPVRRHRLGLLKRRQFCGTGNWTEELQYGFIKYFGIAHVFQLSARIERPLCRTYFGVATVPYWPFCDGSLGPGPVSRVDPDRSITSVRFAVANLDL